MSEPAAKQRQMIDLGEFERRLNRSPAPAQNDDPLAELARLVGGIEDRFGSMFQTRPSHARAIEPQQPDFPPEPDAPDWLVEESHLHAQPGPTRRVDFADIEAGLRGSVSHDFDNFGDYAGAQHQVQDEDDSWLDAPGPPPVLPDEYAPRSRLPLYATAAIIMAGMAGIGGTFALKRTPASAQQIALITAPTSPTKVAAPTEAKASASASASILDKTPQPTPTSVVSHSEQPVDVNAVAHAAPAVLSQPRSAAAMQLASTAPADSVPVPPPPNVEAQQQGGDLADMMQPHKVKTIVIHPEASFDGGASAPSAAPAPVGSIMPPSMASDYNVTPAAPSPARAADPPAAKTASARDDLPWTSQPAAPAPASAAAPPAPKPHVQKLERIARAEALDADAAAPSRGSFSVQLAAPATEAEARAALTRLTRSYGAELRGYHLKFHIAKVAGKTVFRVRVGALSHEAAISLCEKLKTKGGACFVARD